MEKVVIGPHTGVVLAGVTGNTVWQRIELVLHREGHTVESFEKANNIGHLGGFTLFGWKFHHWSNFDRAMKSEKEYIPRRWVVKVLESYPKYFYDWILYGEGEMLREPFRKR